MMNLAGTNHLPVASLQPVANARQQWVALALGLPANVSATQILSLLGSDQGLLQATNNLPVLLPCADPFSFAASDLEHLPNGRAILCIPASRCSVPTLEAQLRSLQGAGARFVVDGCLPPEFVIAPQFTALRYDYSSQLLPAARETMRKLTGLHIVSQVNTLAAYEECKSAGFSWFAGNYVLHTGKVKSEATSRGRLLKLLALVARDADARDLENLLKQDLALSFHLLKLVNSAAFAPSSPITSFTQAINVLGRRQLQRWLQLLLYARTEEDNQINPLQPLAALRASFMEGLCAASGGSRDMQDQAFMVGMFSLLNVALATGLDDVIQTLKLDQEMVDALLHRQGRLGALLNLVEQASTGILPDLTSLEITTGDYWLALVKAYHWACVVLLEA